MPGAGGIPAAAGQRGTGATGPHGAPGLRRSGSAGTRQGRRPGAHGRPETVSLRTADGRTMNVTSPDGQGQVRITVDDGSGHPKAYDIDFSQGAGLAKGGATAQGGGFAGGDMGQPGAHGSLDTSGLGQQSAMPGDAGSVDPTRVGMAGAGQGGSGLPGQDAPAGPPDTGPGSDPGAAGQGLNAAGGTAHAIHPDASGTAVIHDGDTTITVTHPDGGSGELKISVDDGSGPPSSYTIEHSTSGADTAAAGQPADPSSPGQPSGSGTGVPAHLGSASVGATGAAYQASLAPDTGGAANQLGFASPASAGGGAPIQHDLASPAAAGSGAPAGGPPAGAGGMHDAAIGGSTPLQAGTGGLSSTTGAAAVAGGAPGPWAGAAGGGVPSHDPQASGLTQGDPSAPAHSGATPGVASLVPSGDPGAGGPGLAQAPGGDPAIGGDQGGHQAGGMPMMGGMGGGQGAQGGDSERGASPWRTSGQLFDDDAEVATIDRISRILGEE
ncbi:MAG: hypothetical protein ACRDTS_11135 [Mycobacterium sp.]